MGWKFNSNEKLYIAMTPNSQTPPNTKKLI